jgi:CBS domain-containing protein
MVATKEVMTEGCECIGENDSVLDASKRLAELDVGGMPICGEDDKLKGMLTDRDIVVKVLAAGKDPAQTKAGELGEGAPVTVGADDSVETALQAMEQSKVRRVLVLDANKKLVGIVSQADIATKATTEQTGELVERISEDS